MTGRDTRWHDHEVATAAAAWLAEPRNVDAYRRMVEAIERRAAWLQPELPADSTPEVFDELGADRPPERLADVIEGRQSAHPPRVDG